MTAEDRARVKSAIDARRRELVKHEPAFSCDECGAPLPYGSRPNRRFCSTKHQRRYVRRYDPNLNDRNRRNRKASHKGGTDNG